MSLANPLMLVAALALAAGCSSWSRIPVEREAILAADLIDKEVRFTSAEGQHAMIVTGIHMPPGDAWLDDGFLRGLDGNVRTTVYFSAIATLDARSIPFYEQAGFDVWLGTVLGAILVVGLIALSIWAAHEWDDDHRHYH